jgi:hypothetical protein
MWKCSRFHSKTYMLIVKEGKENQKMNEYTKSSSTKHQTLFIISTDYPTTTIPYP